MPWSARVEERHDFTPDELDPSWRSTRPAPPVADSYARALTGITSGPLPTADDELYERINALQLERKLGAARWIQGVWGDDLFVSHLMQLTEPAEWLDERVYDTQPDGTRTARRACARMCFADLPALHARLEVFVRRGPLFVDHPRRRAIVLPGREAPRTVAPEADEERRVADAIAAYRDKALSFTAAKAALHPWVREGVRPPADVARRWLSALVSPANTLPDDADIDTVLREVEGRWGTFLAPLVQTVYGDDLFAERASQRFYAHHWLASAAPMCPADLTAVEAHLVASWQKRGARHRYSMLRMIPVDALLEEALAEPGASPTERCSLIYLLEDPAAVRAHLRRLANEHTPPAPWEVPAFVHRFGFDLDGLFELVVSREGKPASSWLLPTLGAALRVRSPQLVRNLKGFTRAKKAAALVEQYLLNEGANAIDGLLEMAGSDAKQRRFALDFLARIAADPRGRALVRELIEGKSAAVKKHAGPLVA